MLFLYRSNRVEAFLPILTSILQCPLDNPLQPEWLCVHSHGTRIWLEQEMSNRMGVWANVYSPFPRELFETLLSKALAGIDLRWMRSEEMTLRILAKWTDAEFLAQWPDLGRYLDRDASALSRYGLACRVARLFDEYAVYRSEMVLQWEQGMNTPVESDPSLRWQPQLWRALFGGQGIRHVASAAAHWCEAIQTGWNPPPDFPSRIVFFGISFLPPLFCSLLDRFARWCDIHLFVPSPSDAYCAFMRSKREMSLLSDDAEREGDRVVAAAEDTHPLLASLGKSWRDFQFLIEDRTTYHESEPSLFIDPASTSASPTLLETLQSDMLRLRRPSFPSERLRDGTITIHACHGPLREVQVLRSCLLALFAEDLDIAPDDVIVMAPDIDIYTPWIAAVFGQDGQEGAIPHTVSDVSEHRRSELFDACTALLQMAESRMSVQEVFDFLSIDSVRKAVGFQMEELTLLMRWVQESGVRWGVDGSHRKRLCGVEFDENSWRFGIERMMLGTAMGQAERTLFADTSPFPGIEGQDCLLLGRFVDVMERLFELVGRIAEPRPLNEWGVLMNEALEHWFAADGDHLYAWIRLRSWFMNLEVLSRESGFEAPIEWKVIARMLRDQVLLQPSQGGFRKGGVTCCSLVPMRNIPFKVVCLIGMNETDFPRKGHRPSFDWIGKHPRIGDRNIRDEDRGLFLEALLSARKRLIITYTGFDVHSGASLPPASVVCELMDVFGEPVESGEQAKTNCPVWMRHPMHAFNPEGFSGDGPVAYAADVDYAIAQAIASPAHSHPPFLSKRYDPAPEADILLDDLIRFYRHPTAVFLEKTIGVSLEKLPEAFSDREPIVLDPLERWRIGSMRLQSGIQGEDLDRLDRSIRRSGKLPPRAVGAAQYQAIRRRTDRLLQEAAVYGIPRNETVVRLMCGGRWITGRLSGIRREGPSGLLVCHYGRLGAGRRIDFWIRHLLLQLSLSPCERRAGCMLGIENDRIQRMVLGPLGEEAVETMERLIQGYDEGLAFPLPFFPETSYAYAESIVGGKREEAAMAEAVRKWEGTDYDPGEGQQEAVRLVYRDRSPLDGAIGGRTSFQETALAVWLPLLQAMETPAEST